MSLTRIVLHWTGGGYTPSALDKKHYHSLIDGEGREHRGDLPPEANSRPLGPRYAAHVLGANTGAIGIAICAMAQANERPFRWGTHPIKPVQIDALCKVAARFARQYRIHCRRDTILTHAEVQQTLGVAQRGKWDITIFPGNLIPGDPIEMGDVLRERIARLMV